LISAKFTEVKAIIEHNVTELTRIKAENQA